MFFRRRRKFQELAGERVVSVVANGALATTGVSLGKLVPVLVIDGEAHPEVAELIRVASLSSKPGDVSVHWGELAERKHHVVLRLQFIRPAEADLVVVLNICEQGILVERMLESEACYLQAGTADTRVSDDPGAQRLHVVLSASEIADRWDDMFRAALIDSFLERGLSKKAAIEGARHVMQQIRHLSQLRMPD